MAKKHTKAKTGKAPVKSKASKIIWKSIKVKAKQLIPTPGNYKIKSDLGRERLQTSLDKYGRAGTVVVNYSKKKGFFDIVDGNSRHEEVMTRNPNEIMEVSIPSRVLTPAEYKEMAAMFDFAKAGEVDMDRILQDLGSTEDFYSKWGLEVPMEMLNKMGAKANIKELEYPEEGEGVKSKGGKQKEVAVSDMRMVQLFFSEKQEAEFRKMEEKGKKKFKVDNTTDFVWSILKASKL
jgi:hypothetical protein